MKFTHYGRTFDSVATFPDTDDGMNKANAFMLEKNREVGLLAAENGLLILVAMADKGVKEVSELCKGFTSTRWEDGFNKRFETHFAQLPGGRMLQSEEFQEFTSSFGASRQWTDTGKTMEQIKEGRELEFIGNYPIPKIAEAACATNM